MNRLIKLDYQGMGMTANREAWFNATEIAALFDKRPIDWLKLPETERYIQALMKREEEKQAESGKILKVRKSHFIKTKRSKYGGTWLHPKLAVAFARWCDVDFAIWCDEQIHALLSGNQTWQAVRAESKIGFQVMAEIIQASRRANGQDTKPHHFSNEALLCNAAITGQFKALQRDTLPAAALTMLTRLEAHNAALIAQGMPYEARKKKLFDMATPIRASMQTGLQGATA